MAAAILYMLRGLSPRVRGNRYDIHDASFVMGPIPACAGEPLVLGVMAALVRAYPRVCGGTAMT